jgi:CheY-like chemotaxis protein
MTAEGSTVLLVEDNATDVLLIRRAFDKARLGNPLHVLGDGDAAVEYLSGSARYADREQFPLPILILLDLKLPRRSGLEVLEWLRGQASLRRIPVVMLTSSEQPRDVNSAYDSGVNSYLVKPVEFDALFDMLKAVSLYWVMFNTKPHLGNGER